MIDQYTRVLEIVAETADQKSADEAVSKLIAHLKSTGRIKMLPSLARELRRIGGRRRLLRPHLEVASEGESSRAIREAKEAGIEGKEAKERTVLLDQLGKAYDRSLIGEGAVH